MMNRTDRRWLASTAVILALTGVAMIGCEEKKPAPRQTSSSGGGMELNADFAPPRATLTGVKLHSKAQFPEERLPTDQAIVVAVARLASAIAEGNHQDLSTFISSRDQAALALLVKSGQWKQQTDATQLVRVCVINEVSTGVFQVGLGIQDAHGAFISAWEGSGSGDVWSFANMPIEPRLAAAAKELDGTDLKLLALPTGTAPDLAGLRPVEQKTKEDEDKEKSPTRPANEPGVLRPDRF